MMSYAKRSAAVYGEKSDGTRVFKGHNIVDKSGNIVLLAGDRELPDGARYATELDIAAAKKAEAERAEREEAAKAEQEAKQRADQAASDAGGGPLQA